MNYIIETISQPWPWYTAGILITITMVSLLFLGKSFGVSSNLRTMCSMAGAGKVNSFFEFNWRAQTWNLLFLFGIMIGGLLAALYLDGDVMPAVSPDTLDDLALIGVSTAEGLNPPQIMGQLALTSLRGWVILIAGGFLIGFGARYAGGCTSGHAISGISNLQIPSVIAVVGFFIGGLIMTHLLLPFII